MATVCSTHSAARATVNENLQECDHQSAWHWLSGVLSHLILLPMPTTKSLNKSLSRVSVELIERRIYLIRGHKVMIDVDLAELYDVSTKRFKQQVRRNLKGFRKIFQLTKEESESLRSQFATSKPAREGMRSQFAISKKIASTRRSG